jgi:hypothetical protein
MKTTKAASARMLVNESKRGPRSVTSGDLTLEEGSGPHRDRRRVTIVCTRGVPT